MILPPVETITDHERVDRLIGHSVPRLPQQVVQGRSGGWSFLERSS